MRHLLLFLAWLCWLPVSAFAQGVLHTDRIIFNTTFGAQPHIESSSAGDLRITVNGTELTRIFPSTGIRIGGTVTSDPTSGFTTIEDEVNIANGGVSIANIPSVGGNPAAFYPCISGAGGGAILMHNGVLCEFTSYVNHGLLYAGTTTSLAQSVNLTFDGTTFTVNSNVTFNGLPSGVSAGYLCINTSTGVLLDSTKLCEFGAIALNYTVGDLFYAGTNTSLAKLNDVTAGSYLRSGGTSTAPGWSTLVLPNAATANQICYATATNTIGCGSAALTYNAGTTTFATTGNVTFSGLPSGVNAGYLCINTGTGALVASNALCEFGAIASNYTVGDVFYASGSMSLAKLNDVAVGSYLRSGGTSTAPLWSTLTLPNAATSGNAMYASGTNVGAFNANFNLNSNGLVGLGGAVNTANLITIGASTASGTDQRGISIANLTTTSAATSAINGYYIGISTAAASYSTANLRGFQFGGIAKGSGHTITRAVGFQSVDFTTGTNNALMFMGDDSTFTGNWGIYQNTTKASYFAGGINLSATTDPGAGILSASSITDTGGSLTVTAASASNVNVSSLGGGFISLDGGYGVGSGGVKLIALTSSAGTALVVDASNYIQKLTSSARYKTSWNGAALAVASAWVVAPDALHAFVRLSPRPWDYTGQRTGAFGFIAEDLDALPIRNVYGSSPLVNYDTEGHPDSNRDFALIGLQHLVLQNHDARIEALERELAALRAVVMH